MPRAVDCLYDDRVTSVHEALRLRDGWRSGRQRKPSFRCRECREPVWPHHDGNTGAAAHFEHRRQNPNCALSDPRTQ